jgi:hypothetical protein
MAKVIPILKKGFVLLLPFVFFVSAHINGKIRLFTFHYNRADFVELQHRCLNKFLKEKNDYELIVLNDATDPKYKQQIEQTCQKLKITCINFPQELHLTGALVDYLINTSNGSSKWLSTSQGSVRHCQLAQYALDNFGYNHDDIVGIMDGDLFLIKEFSLREYLSNYDFIGAVQTDREAKGIEYIWIGAAFFNVKKLPNIKTLSFDLTFVNETWLDSGGRTYYYLKNNPDIRIKKYYRQPITDLPRNDKQKLKKLGFSQKEIRFFKRSLDCSFDSTPFLTTEFHIDNHFLHYANSRSKNKSYQKAKTKLFNDFFNDILS